jgi:hypothetical protein
MDVQLLLVCVLVDFAVQIAAGAVAIALKTEKFYDLVGSSTFITLVLISVK